jgi:hypothetical protein
MKSLQKNTFQKSFVLFRVLLWLKKSFSLALPILYALCGFFFAFAASREIFFGGLCSAETPHWERWRLVGS